MVTILSWVALILLALVALLLLVPIHVRGEVQLSSELLWGRFELLWAWGLLKVRATSGGGATLHVLGLRLSRLKGEGKQKKKQKKSRESGVTLRPQAFWVHRGPLFSALRRFLGALRLQGSLQGEVGLECPHHTVMLAMAINRVSAQLPAMGIDLEPNFVDPVVDITGRGQGCLWLVHLLALAVKLYLEQETRRAWQALR